MRDVAVGDVTDSGDMNGATRRFRVNLCVRPGDNRRISWRAFVSDCREDRGGRGSGADVLRRRGKSRPLYASAVRRFFTGTAIPGLPALHPGDVKPLEEKKGNGREENRSGEIVRCFEVLRKRKLPGSGLLYLNSFQFIFLFVSSHLLR